MSRMPCLSASAAHWHGPAYQEYSRFDGIGGWPLGFALKMRRARASCLLEPLVILARGALLLE